MYYPSLLSATLVSPRPAKSPMTRSGRDRFGPRNEKINTRHLPAAEAGNVRVFDLRELEHEATDGAVRHLRDLWVAKY
jgi:hypothetical protein